MILAEIGDFSRFDPPDKILAYAGLFPSTYQSGKLDNAYAHMEKRGSRYLRYALYNATKYVCHWDASFSAYTSRGVSTVRRGASRKPASEKMQGAACLLYGHGGPAPAPAHPFVRPAFDTRSEDAYDEIRRVLRDELLK